MERAKELIANAPGCKLVDDLPNGLFPMPLDASNQDTIYVGRIREDLTDDCGLNLWCCGDQVRKGAATNAVQIAELLLESVCQVQSGSFRLLLVCLLRRYEMLSERGAINRCRNDSK